MKQVAVAVVGMGFMGETFAEAVSRHCPNARLALLCDVDEERAKRAAVDFGAEHAASYQAVLERDDVDVIFLETPHCMHYPQALAAVAAGKHVMIEKPMACTAEQCDEIIAAAEENKALCSVSFTQRSRRCNIKTKSLLDSGDLGAVRHIVHFQMEGCHSIGDYPSWQSRIENIGLTFGHAIHSFDFLRWLTGSDIVSVYARLANYEPQYEVDGTVMAMIEFANGVAASIYFSGQVKKPLFPEHIFRSEIICENGLVDSDSYSRTRTNTSGEWETVEVQQPVPMPFRDNRFSMIRMESYIRHCRGFFDAVLAGGEPPITGRDGREAVAAVLAAYESARTGQVVRLK